MSEQADTDCRKCGAPMPPLKQSPNSGRLSGLMDIAQMTITGYRCEKCDHWNNLKSRKSRK